MARFEGKHVLVTGGTSGIGLATAQIVAAEGGRVAVTGRSARHRDTAKAALPDSALVIENDAADPDQVDALVATLREEFGQLDAVFLNAGFGTFRPIEALDADHIYAMLATDGAGVVVTGSVSPYIGQGGGSVYAATKGAVQGIVRAWARELAPAGIRVNTLAPGPIETNFFEATGLSQEDAQGFAEMVKGMVPLGRFGSPEEVGRVAAFLLSDDASYVTGSEYVVDGGMTMRWALRGTASPVRGGINGRASPVRGGINVRNERGTGAFLVCGTALDSKDEQC